jgi:hypothetical protein
MERIFEGKDDIAQMANRAKERFNANYSKEASVSSMCGIVEQLIEGTR